MSSKRAHHRSAKAKGATNWMMATNQSAGFGISFKRGTLMGANMPPFVYSTRSTKFKLRPLPGPAPFDTRLAGRTLELRSFTPKHRSRIAREAARARWARVSATAAIPAGIIKRGSWVLLNVAIRGFDQFALPSGTGAAIRSALSIESRATWCATMTVRRGDVFTRRVRTIGIRDRPIPKGRPR
jgi:hypothetical protein